MQICARVTWPILNFCNPLYILGMAIVIESYACIVCGAFDAAFAKLLWLLVLNGEAFCCFQDKSSAPYYIASPSPIITVCISEYNAINSGIMWTWFQTVFVYLYENLLALHQIMKLCIETGFDIGKLHCCFVEDANSLVANKLSCICSNIPSVLWSL